ncbi:MAG: YjjG family noncanonical pyrimidine nucleotidase [Clostridia bacterium]|nr:YjjG family noncanonical pyrimidine nucleotidase [Clostridia bacterium]
MIKNILFDLDDTLFDFKEAERRSLQKTLLSYGIDHNDETVALYSHINHSQWKLLEKGELDRATLKVRRFALFSEALGIPFDAKEVSACYENNLASSHFLIDGALELLTSLKGRYRLYIVTNGFAHIQKSRLAGAKIESFFDAVFISQEIGAEKPSPAFFDACFARIPDFQKSETVLIGDSISSDIKGGLQAGITTVLFCPNGKPNSEISAHHHIARLADFHNILSIL